MSKIMPLEVLSGIKDAKPSQSIDELFDVVSKASPHDSTDMPVKIDEGNIIVTVEKLRDDVIIESTNQEKDLIKRNFPREKNGFLVVSKVIER